MSGYFNNVETSVWDRLFEVTNNGIKFEAPIDMNGHNINMKNGQIKGLEDGNENDDAVNIKQINEMESNISKYIKTEINKVKTVIDKVKTDDTNNSNILTALYNYIIKNELKEQIIKDMYFSDSGELKTPNGFLFQSNADLDLNNPNNLTFYYVFKHNASTNNVMTIELLWSKYTPGIDGVIAYVFLHIHISKSQIKISRNPLINEPHLRLINIPNKAVGKQIWFWIWTQGTTFHLITSGSNVVTLNLRNVGLSADFKFVRLNVDDSPFPRIRGFITSNVYDNNSEAYGKVREFERAQGTII